MVDKINILVTGANGQLGRSIQDICESYDSIFFSWKRKSGFNNFSLVENFLKLNKINCSINCAAYTDIDSSEKKYKICNNMVLAVGNIAKLCSWLILASSYFNRLCLWWKKISYQESDYTRPLNKYGISKLNAEKII